VDDAEPLKMRIPAAGKLPRDSDLLMDQMRAIDNRRLIRGPLHRLPPATVKREVIALLEILGMKG
jgi:mRNA interferase MazF